MATSDEKGRPMAPPGPQQRGADVGGISRNAESGLEDSMDRMAEHRDDDASGAATIGQGSAGGAQPRLDRGGQGEPGDTPASPLPSSEPGMHGATPRHSVAQGDTGTPATAATQAGAAPAEPGAGVPPDQRTTAGSGPPESPDEGPLESWGRAVSEVVIGTLDDGATQQLPRKKPDQKH